MKNRRRETNLLQANPVSEWKYVFYGKREEGALHLQKYEIISSQNCVPLGSDKLYFR